MFYTTGARRVVGFQDEVNDMPGATKPPKGTAFIAANCRVWINTAMNEHAKGNATWHYINARTIDCRITVTNPINQADVHSLVLRFHLSESVTL